MRILYAISDEGKHGAAGNVCCNFRNIFVKNIMNIIIQNFSSQACCCWFLCFYDSKIVFLQICLYNFNLKFIFLINTWVRCFQIVSEIESEYLTITFVSLCRGLSILGYILDGLDLLDCSLQIVSVLQEKNCES